MHDDQNQANDQPKPPRFNMGLHTNNETLQQALDAAWEELGSVVKPKRGRQTKTREHFDVLMLNILDSHGATLLVSLDKNTYLTESKLNKDKSYRYNPLSMTNRFPQLLKRLEEAGLVNLKIGKYAPHKGESRLTEFTPSQKLIDLLPTDVPLGSLKDASESVRLGLGDDGSKKYIDYEETDVTEMWREQLQRFNDALSVTHLWVRDEGDPSEGRSMNGTTTHYRMFCRGSFECGGRIYSPRLQNLPKADRKRLYINGERTTEPDFKGLHIAIAYAREGLEMIGDPYRFYGHVPRHAKDERTVTRMDAKQLALIAINASSRQSASQALIEEIPAGLSRRTRRKLWDAMLKQHSAIAHYFGSDSGVHFQRFDSDIMLLTLSTLLDRGIVAIPVHDSVVVTQKHEAVVVKTLRQCGEAVLADAGYRIRLPVTQPDQTYDSLSEMLGRFAQGSPEHRMASAELLEWGCIDHTVREAIGMGGDVSLDKALRRPMAGEGDEEVPTSTP